MPSLASLHVIRARYAPRDTDRKRAVLRHVVRQGFGTRSLRALERLHGDLLFLLAFPDSPAVRALAVRALRRVGDEIDALPALARARADDSGLTGTTSRYTWSCALARWLGREFPDELAIDWDGDCDEAPIAGVVAAAAHPSEDDALDEMPGGVRAWLDGAAAATGSGDFATLMAMSPEGPAGDRLFRARFDDAEIPLVWKLLGSRASTARNVMAGRPVQARHGMRRAPGRTAVHASLPLQGVRRAKGVEADALIRVGRAALAARCREVFATSNASHDEVWIAPLGEGAELAVFGTAPAVRSSIEANYGYVLFSNGVPIGYGGVTPFHRQANTGINIFPEFRGSEAAFLFAQTLRAFHTLFGVTHFVVNAVQFGEANDEAIDSGAFWFYWRLGFRPTSSVLRGLATREARRLSAHPGARSRPALLRRLARGNLALSLQGSQAGERINERLLVRVALAATRILRRADPHSLERASRVVSARVATRLDAKTARWPRAERDAFERLAPLLAVVPALGRLAPRDKRALVELARAKGKPQERGFARRAVAHARLFAQLDRATRRAAGTGTGDREARRRDP